MANPNTAIQKLVNERHAKAWLNPAIEDKRQTLGVLIAGFYTWNNNDVAVAFLAALEDANAHEERAFINDYLKSRGFNLDKKTTP